MTHGWRPPRPRSNCNAPVLHLAPSPACPAGAKERHNGNPALPFAPICTNSRLLPTRYAVCVSALRAWARGSTPPVAAPPAEVVAALRAKGLEGLCIDSTIATSSSLSQGRRPFTTPAGPEGPGFRRPTPPGPKARHKCVTVQRQDRSHTQNPGTRTRTRSSSIDKGSTFVPLTAPSSVE